MSVSPSVSPSEAPPEASAAANLALLEDRSEIALTLLLGSEDEALTENAVAKNLEGDSGAIALLQKAYNSLDQVIENARK